MNLIQNLIAWAVYSAISFCLLPKFFGNTDDRISLALLVGFLFGLLNKISQDLTNIREELRKEKEPEGKKVLL